MHNERMLDEKLNGWIDASMGKRSNTEMRIKNRKS